MDRPDDAIDLGLNHWMTYFGWHPDRELNPQYADVPDIERLGAVVGHVMPGGEDCDSGIYFDTKFTKELFPTMSVWQVVQEEPLTLSPSLLCTICGDHGFIREGKWVAA